MDGELMLYAMTFLSFMYLGNLVGLSKLNSRFHINLGLALCGFQFGLFAFYLSEIFLKSPQPLIVVRYNHGDLLLPLVYGFLLWTQPKSFQKKQASSPSQKSPLLEQWYT